MKVFSEKPLESIQTIASLSGSINHLPIIQESEHAGGENRENVFLVRCGGEHDIIREKRL
jgi:hypothetical protein